ncbi:MAG: hypothetical protein LBV75_07630 [Paludibacter sp.]|jgi:hypothetical protein|nr:hypothetical protein [Paludibacter sp.]
MTQANIFYSFHYSFEQTRPSVSDILDFIKSSDVDSEHPVYDSIRQAFVSVEGKTQIDGGFVVRQVSDIQFDCGKQVNAYLKGSRSYAFFVCTVGDIFTEVTRKFNREGNFLDAYIADAIGSLTVENAMNLIQSHLENEMGEQGLKITNRYSPGYCNWALSAQPQLFELIGENAVNVSLTESCLMLPIKSVSGVIGIGENVKKREYACQICNNQTCIYRKIINK